MDVIFDGKKLNDYFWLQDIQGLGMPQTRDRELNFTSTDGGVYDGTNLDTRVMTLSVTMIGNDTKSVYEQLDAIKEILAPWKGEKKLTFSRYPDRYINARYSGSMNIEQIGLMQRFPVSFRASDPLFYENNANSVSLAASQTVKNKGTWPTNNSTLTVTINAGSTFNITNNTTGKNLVLKNTSAGTAIVFVDFKNCSITSVDKNTNYMGFYVSGSFFALNPGDNNITATGFAVGTNAFSWKSAWI